MNTVLQVICDALKDGESLALATVVSTPAQSRLAGARMVIRSDGRTVGSIGGGVFEAEAQARAVRFLSAGRGGAQILEFPGDADVIHRSPCGNGMEVIIEPVFPSPENERIFHEALQTLRRGDICHLITSLQNGDDRPAPVRRMLLREDGSLLGEPFFPGNRLPAVLATARSVRAPLLTEVDSQRILVAPWGAPGAVFLFGAGHVAREVAELSCRAGFRTVVLDDRERYANRERFPLAGEIRVIDSFETGFRNLKIDQDSYVLIVTRGHRYEKTLVKQALGTRAGYIGLIGSIRKRDVLFSELAAEGFSIDDLLRVYCPVGISIMAETPLEIAVSIVAQLVLTRARKAACESRLIHRSPPVRANAEESERNSARITCTSP